MPNSETFKIKPIKIFVEENIAGKKCIVDPFANSNKYGTISNDLNPEYSTTYHMDALEFLKKLPTESADVVLYDPPYSIRQVNECYAKYGKEQFETIKNSQYWSFCKTEVGRILKVGGIALCFGWNSNGIGKKRGFILDEVLLVAHGAEHTDTICTKEIKVQGLLISETEEEE